MLSLAILMEIELVITDIDDYECGIRHDETNDIDTDIDDYECGIICINAYDDKYDDELKLMV